MTVAGRQLTVPCRIVVRQTHETLEAHVELGRGLLPGPGDRVVVHGAPVSVGFGESAVFDREATLTRATPLEALWTKLLARFQITELYEVSFSPGRP